MITEIKLVISGIKGVFTRNQYFIIYTTDDKGGSTVYPIDGNNDDRARFIDTCTSTFEMRGGQQQLLAALNLMTMR